MISAEHQRAIEAAIPAGVKVSAEFWRGLDVAIDLYRAQQERRAAKPPVKERKRWTRIEKLTEALGKELRAARMGLSWEHEDPLWPNRALLALWEIRHRAEANRIGYEMIGAVFNRRSNPHQILLFAAICDLWTIHLRQELTYSMSPASEPCGPLIRFFMACLAPMLGVEIPLHAIRGVINRVRSGDPLFPNLSRRAGSRR